MAVTREGDQQAAYEAGRRQARAQLRAKGRDPARAQRTRYSDPELDEYHEAGFQEVIGDTTPPGREGARRARRGRGAAHRVTRGRGARAIRRGVTRTPVGGSGISSAWQILGVGLALIALYLVLTKASTVAKAFSGVQKGLSWLASPKTAIPYGPNH